MATLEALPGFTLCLADLLLHTQPAAGRTGLWNRSIPGGEVTLRIAQAAPERLAPLGAPLGEIAGGALGTLESHGNRASTLAVRVRGAGKEFAEPPGLDHHGRATEMTLLVAGPIRNLHLLQRLHVVAGVLVLEARQVRTEAAGSQLDLAAALGATLLGQLLGVEPVGIRHQRLHVDRIEGFGKRPIEGLEHPLPPQFAVFDAVQLVFHFGGELDIEDSGELADHDLFHRLAQFGREKASLVYLDILPGRER